MSEPTPLNALVDRIKSFVDYHFTDRDRYDTRTIIISDLLQPSEKVSRILTELFDFSDAEIARGFRFNLIHTEVATADVGGVFRSITYQMSETLPTFKLSQTLHVPMFARYEPCFLPSRDEHLAMLSTSEFELSMNAYVAFGKLMISTLLHDGTFPAFLHLSVVKYVLDEPLNHLEDGWGLGEPYTKICSADVRYDELTDLC